MLRYPVVLWLSLAAAPLHAQWIIQTSGTTAEFRGLHAVSDRVVWAAGRGGIVARTEDGGASWRADSIPGAGGLFLIAIHAQDARRAWVAGTAFSGPSLGRIYRTDDGGRSWEKEYENAAPGVFLDGMAFWDERHGVAFGDPIGERLLVVTTADGGAHWDPLPAASLPVMAAGEAAFAASGTAIAVRGGAEVWIVTGGGPHAHVLHSRDRGATWEAFDTPAAGAAAKGLFGIAMGSGRRGVAVGGDYRQRDSSVENLLLTGDGGKSWRIATSPGLAGVQYGVTHAGRGFYLAAGPTGSAKSEDDGVTWTRLDGAGFNTVSCASHSCWGAGVDGRIARLVIPEPPPARPR